MPKLVRLLLQGTLALAALGIAAAPLFADPTARLPSHGVLSPWWVGAGLAVFALALALEAGGRLWHREGRDPRRLAGLDVLLLGALPLYLVYVGNGTLLSSGDNHPTRHLPSLIQTQGTIDLSSRPGFQTHHGLHYSVLEIDGRILPMTPMGTAFLAVPYTSLALAASAGEITPQLLRRWEKHFAALLATATACLLFLALRRPVGDAPAALATGVFALATPVVTHNAQALWSTSGELFWIVVALYALIGRRAGPGAAAAAGAAMGLAVLCRTTALLPMGLFGAALLWRDRRAAIPYCLAGGATLTLVTLLLWHWYGHPLGGHGINNLYAHLYEGSPNALLGSLLSPSRGLLVFFPYVLLAPLALVLARRDPVWRTWCSVSVATTLALTVLYASYVKWWGGWCLGPRNMTEAAPFLAILTVPLWLGLRELPVVARGALVAGVVFAAATQLLAVYRPAAPRWNAAVDVDRHPEVLASWRNSQLAAIWLPGWVFRLDPADAAALEGTSFDAQHSLRIDLSSLANARYDHDPFRPGAPAPARFARIDPEALNLPKARFHFAPRGSLNALSSAGGTSTISVPRLPVRRIHAVLAAEPSSSASQSPLGSLRVRYADGGMEDLPIRPGREIFPYEGGRRPKPLEPEHLYFGAPDGPQRLADSVFVPGRDALVTAIELVGAPRDARSAIVLLALTLELDALASTRSVDIGEPAFRPLLRSGWWDDESSEGGFSWVWAQSGAAELLVFLSEQDAVSARTLELRCWPFAFEGAPSQSLTVSINGERTGELDLAPGVRTYMLSVPEGSLAPGRNELRFQFAYAERPQRVKDSRDPRLLSVAFDSLQIHGTVPTDSVEAEKNPPRDDASAHDTFSPRPLEHST